MTSTGKLVALTPLLVLVFQAIPAKAATEEEDLALTYGDQSTISLATGSKQPLRRAPAVATVITAEDIATIGATDLDEVLETVPGLHVNRTAGEYNPVYIIRGIGVVAQTNPQVLLLVNGIPMASAYRSDKGGIWGGYPVEHIARIEIIRGPGSALYGADAFAGVINIVTKTASDTPGTQIGLRRGSFNTTDTWLNHGSKQGPVEVAGYLRLGSSDGQREEVAKDGAQANVTTAPGSVSTGRDALDGNLDLSKDKWRWRSNIKARENVGMGAGVASSLDPDSRGESKHIATDLSWTDPQFSQHWALSFTAAYIYHKEDASNGILLFPAGSNFGFGAFPNGVIGGPLRSERQYRLSTSATYTGWTDHRLRLGVGYDDLDLYKTATYKNYTIHPTGAFIPTGPVQEYADIQPHIRPQRRKISYAYVQDEWQLANDWSLTAGVRHDHYSDFGNTTNPRVALVWDIDYNLTAKLLYGEAFRAPSFNEQYGINPVANGNPDLRPETIKTTEAAFSWQARSDTQVNVGFFTYRMRDMIRTVSNAPLPGSTYRNFGDQNGNGMELETVWDFSRSLRLTGHYAHQKSIDQSTGKDAGYAPHSETYGRADWRFASGWLASSQFNWVTGRRRTATDFRPNVSDYTTVDLTLQTHTKRDQWHFLFGVRNVFDEDVREPSLAPGQIRDDLPMAGRSYFAQTRFQF